MNHDSYNTESYELIGNLMGLVFDKAIKESGKDTAYGLSKYLNEVFNDEISERSLTRYYDGYILLKKSERTHPDDFVLNKLAAYIGYENYLEFEKNYFVKNENQALKKQLKIVQDKLRNYRIFGVIILTILMTISMVSVLKYYKKECMVWVTDHYEKVKCNGLENERKLDEVILNKFKKVKVCKDSIFFENGQPRIHYIRHDNIIEFFTYQGEHPTIKGKFTSPITQTIIESRVKSCDSL